MNKKYNAIFISMDWVFDAQNSNTKEHNQNAIDFINKLTKYFIVKLGTTKDEVIVANWLIKHQADNLIPCLVEEETKFFLYLNDDCIRNCNDFDKFYEVISAVKDL